MTPPADINRPDHRITAPVLEFYDDDSASWQRLEAEYLGDAIDEQGANARAIARIRLEHVGIVASASIF